MLNRGVPEVVGVDHAAGNEQVEVAGYQDRLAAERVIVVVDGQSGQDQWELKGY